MKTIRKIIPLILMTALILTGCHSAEKAETEKTPSQFTTTQENRDPYTIKTLSSELNIPVDFIQGEDGVWQNGADKIVLNLVKNKPANFYYQEYNAELASAGNTSGYYFAENEGTEFEEHHYVFQDGSNCWMITASDKDLLFLVLKDLRKEEIA